MVTSGSHPTAAPSASRYLKIGVGLYTGQGSVASGDGYREATVLARAAEDAGFDSFWVSEHHGWDDAYLPSPLVLLAALGAVTERIELGAGLVLAPLYHPVRLAADIAVLDQLTNGRLILGLGLGYIDKEYAAFGVDRSSRAARLDDVIGVLRLAGTGEPFSYAGRSIVLDDVRVTPSVCRDGGVPIWVGAYSDAAVRRAGTAADGHLIGRGSPHIIDSANQILAGVRRPDDPSFTRAVNVTLVLDDEGGAAGSARAAFAAQQLMYERVQHGANVYSSLIPDPAGGEVLAEGSIDSYIQVAGSAGEVVAGLEQVIERLSGWSHVHLVLRVLFPGEAIEVQVERLRMIGNSVLPQLRRL
ncbi:unannotated protein [freshwater metagenome]|uniref:Unannotated protein n=1 Tax=freshwater metagenome TaxID=449393 RepID=A0A6J7DRG1_9ZZZZ